MRHLSAVLVASLLLGCAATPTEVAVSAADLPIPEQPFQEGQRALRVANVRLGASADALLVDVAPTVRVGEPLVVQFTTYGGGCIDADTTVAIVSGRLASVIPYQRYFTPRSGGGCTRELILERRTVHLVFTSTGSATLRFIGRTSDLLGPLITVERRVLVRE